MTPTKSAFDGIKRYYHDEEYKCMFDDPEGPYVRVDDVLDRLKALTANTWLDIKDAPRDGTKLLLCVGGEDLGYKSGSQARVIGYYAPKYTLPAHEDCDPETMPTFFEFHETSGEYFACEGFYADCFENQYGDEISKSVKPTYWMHLPPKPEQPPC